jgi:hypothetical protein
MMFLLEDGLHLDCAFPQSGPDRASQMVRGRPTNRRGLVQKGSREATKKVDEIGTRHIPNKGF